MLSSRQDVAIALMSSQQLWLAAQGQAIPQVA